MKHLTKRLIAIALSLATVNSYATKYFVSAAGNDAAAGTSELTAWRTLSKINAQTFANGDTVLLRRGDTFYGQLRIKNAGLTVTAYGSGNNPVITGLDKVVTTWTSVSGSVWQTVFASNKPAIINNLAADGKKLPIARHPNRSVHHGYFNFESHVGLTQITDNELPATPDWTGAEVVIRSERWRLNRTYIVSQSGSTLTIPTTPGIQNLRDGYGYFFVNDLRAIDTLGEWAYNAGTGTIYLSSATDPNSRVIYFPRIDTLLTIRNAANVTFKNIELRYSNKLSIWVSNSPNSTLDSLRIIAGGGDGVNYASCACGVFSNCVIDEINNTGIFAATNNSQLSFQNNIITNIGNEAFGKSKTFIGMDIDCPNTVVANNVVAKTGYCAILSAGLNNLVKHNFVDSACLALEDNGGIYTNYQNGANIGEIIEENIVLRTVGERLGAPESFSIANGIYVDNLSKGVTVRNNTVAFVNGMGYYANFNDTGNRFYNNTAFSCGVSEMDLHKPNTPPVYAIRENILVTTDTSASHNVFNGDRTEDFTYSDMGTFTNNYIIQPFQNKAIIFAYKANGFKRNLRYTPYEWEAAAPKITGTVAAPISFATTTDPNEVIRFYYNKTTAAQLITLPTGRFIDAKNQPFCGTFTLQPFASVVLFKVSNNACGIPAACGNPTGLTITSITNDTARLSWGAVTNAINYDVRYKAEADTTWKYAHNLKTAAVDLINLSPETYYQTQVRASCYGAEGVWQSFPLFKSAPAPGEHVFINANYTNCSPASAFAAVQSDTDNKWTLQSSGGIGTVDRDYMRSTSATENCPVITLNATNQLDSCNTYDIYVYYTSPASQPWKIQAKLSSQPSFTLLDRNTPGAVLVPDSAGNLDRLFRYKIGTVQHTTGFSVDIDDYSSGVSTSRSMFDGVGYRKVAGINPLAPDSLISTSITPSAVNIKWCDLAVDETGYVIERKQGTAAFSVLTTLPANATTYSDVTVSPGDYTYRVYAIHGGCKSAYANELIAHINP